jgi:hypothetical protein
MSASEGVTSEQKQQWQQEWDEIQKLGETQLIDALRKADNLLERVLTGLGYPIAEEEARVEGTIWTPGEDSTDVVEDFMQTRAMVRVLDISPFPPVEKSLRVTMSGYEHLFTWAMNEA